MTTAEPLARYSARRKARVASGSATASYTTIQDTTPSGGSLTGSGAPLGEALRYATASHIASRSLRLGEAGFRSGVAFSKATRPATGGPAPAC